MKKQPLTEPQKRRRYRARPVRETFLVREWRSRLEREAEKNPPPEKNLQK